VAAVSDIVRVEDFDWFSDLGDGIEGAVARIDRVETIEELAELRERVGSALDAVQADIAAWEAAPRSRPEYAWVRRAKYRVNQLNRMVRRIDWRTRMLAREGRRSSRELIAIVPTMEDAEIEGLYSRTLEKYRGIYAERKVFAILPDRDDEALRRADGMLAHLRGLLVALRHEAVRRSMGVGETPAEIHAAVAEANARQAEAERAKAGAHLEATRMQCENAARKHAAMARRELVVINLIRDRGLVDRDTLSALFQEAKAIVGGERDG
jgi:hypothetical protein